MEARTFEGPSLEWPSFGLKLIYREPVFNSRARGRIGSKRRFLASFFVSTTFKSPVLKVLRIDVSSPHKESIVRVTFWDVFLSFLCVVVIVIIVVVVNIDVDAGFAALKTTKKFEQKIFDNITVKKSRVHLEWVTSPATSTLFNNLQRVSWVLTEFSRNNE